MKNPLTVKKFQFAPRDWINGAPTALSGRVAWPGGLLECRADETVVAVVRGGLQLQGGAEEIVYMDVLDGFDDDPRP